MKRNIDNLTFGIFIFMVCLSGLMGKAQTTGNVALPQLEFGDFIFNDDSGDQRFKPFEKIEETLKLHGFTEVDKNPVKCEIFDIDYEADEIINRRDTIMYNRTYKVKDLADSPTLSYELVMEDNYPRGAQYVITFSNPADAQAFDSKFKKEHYQEFKKFPYSDNYTEKYNGETIDKYLYFPEEKGWECWYIVVKCINDRIRILTENNDCGD